MRKLFLLLMVFCVVLGVYAGGSQEGYEKTYYKYLPAKIQVFDPANLTDLYTSTVAGDIMEGLLRYKYLADNYELEPALADGMPVMSADGLTLTFKIKKGIYYYDPLMEVFPQGKGREVKAQDFVLSMKRLADPDSKSGGWWLFDGFIVGLNEWREAAISAKKADYSKVIEGAKALDDYTLQVKLTKVFPQILYNFAMTFMFPTIQEALDYYGDEWMNFPIGTNAYILDHDESVPGTQWVLKKNPAYRGEKYPSGADIGPIAKGKGLDAYAGKALPFCDVVVYNIILEDAPRWLRFMNGEIDFIAPPKDNFAQAFQNNKLTPEMVAKGIVADINPSLDVTYFFFNMEDSVVGGYSESQKKLRQAMSAAYDIQEYIRIFDNGRAVSAHTVIPPNFGGYDAKYVNPYKYNLDKAKQLIAEAGYPDGKGLPTLTYDMSGTSALSRETTEFFAQNMAKIGIKIDIVANDWPTFLDKIDNHQVQLGGIAWGADYPDAQNFLQLLYGPNAAPGPNAANYDSAAFNALYEKASTMYPSAERDALYTQAAKIAVEDGPWIVGRNRLSYALVHPWVKNRYFRDIGTGYSKYIDIDLDVRAARAGK